MPDLAETLGLSRGPSPLQRSLAKKPTFAELLEAKLGGAGSGRDSMILGGLLDALMAPGRALNPELDDSGQPINPVGPKDAMNVAMNVMGGGMAAGRAPAGSLGMNVYRGQSVHNKGGKFWTTDKEWARQFTQSGQEHEVAKSTVSPKMIHRPEEPVYAGDPDAVDIAIAQARKDGKKAVWLNEGAGQPDSIFVFDKSALGTK